jgi:hypothetical protein
VLAADRAHVLLGLLDTSFGARIWANSAHTRRAAQRFGDDTLSMGSPDPFETDLVVPFPLEDAQEPAASA